MSSVAGLATAGPVEDEARAHVKMATAAFNLGQYDEALAEYETAYRLVPDPALLYNIGQAHRLAGNADKAIIAYKSYLRTAPADAPNREQVQRHLEQLEAVTWTPGPAPKATAASVPAAKNLAPRAEPPAFPAIDLSAMASPASEPPASAPIYKRWWFWTAAGAVVIGGVTTAILLSRGQEDPIKGNVDPPVVVVR
ncbi:MAG: tetratricopeptide repeat protein [Deltaproteobacteria bacterium]|nr:tetratricopeptide repeat protein [Deltaproteobacteria bacterium]